MFYFTLNHCLIRKLPYILQYTTNTYKAVAGRETGLMYCEIRALIGGP